MEIYVVRHGQTDYNVKKVFPNRVDISVSSLDKPMTV